MQRVSALFVFIALLALPTLSMSQTSGDKLEGPLVVTNTAMLDGFVIVDIGTGTKRELSFGDGEQIFGGFSPDGCEIVFTWETQQGQGNLYAARLDGSNIRQLTFIGRTGALSYRMWEPQWSSDNQRIAFTFVRYYDPPTEPPYRTMHIAWVPVTGGNPSFYSNSGSEYQPRWSPDSKWLVYVSEQAVTTAVNPEEVDATNVRPEIWITSIDGRNKRRLIGFTESGAFNPQWSPDGTLIAFQNEPVKNSHQLMITSADGALSPFVINRQQAMVLDYTWQPTGRNLIASMRNFQGEGENVLWTLPADENGEDRASELFPQPYVDFPRYSSDGRWLAFRQAYELAVYDTAKGETVLYGEETLSNSPPIWSPTDFQGETACPQ